MPISKEEVELWDAINAYVVTCGGDPGDNTVSRAREAAVVRITRAVHACETKAINDTEDRRGPRPLAQQTPAERFETVRRTHQNSVKQACETLVSRGLLTRSSDAYALTVRGAQIIHGYRPDTSTVPADEAPSEK